MSYRLCELENEQYGLTSGWMKYAPAVQIGSLITLLREPDGTFIVWKVVTLGPIQHEPPDRFWKVSGIDNTGVSPAPAASDPPTDRPAR